LSVYESFHQTVKKCCQQKHVLKNLTGLKNGKRKI